MFSSELDCFTDLVTCNGNKNFNYWLQLKTVFHRKYEQKKCINIIEMIISYNRVMLFRPNSTVCYMVILLKNNSVHH